MTQVHTEETLEAAIEAILLEGGWEKGHPDDYDRELGVLPEHVFGYIQDTQPDLWENLHDQLGEDRKDKLLTRLTRDLDKRGTLYLLRNGFKFYGEQIQLAQFRPPHRLNPDVWEDYQKNRLVITRQAAFLPGKQDSVDLMLSLNGLPVATAELKNPLSGQTVRHAMEQYKRRDPTAKLFQWKKRALVHFAVDPDQVYMTTRLQGEDTHFLPFNKGHKGGAGNPPNPEGYRTAYLWEEVWQYDSFLEIVGQFIHVLKEEEWRDGKKRTKEILLFPRYHQLDVVRKLVQVTRQTGPGNNRLVQHSAGSGKTASISWLAHQLASLHDEDEEVFDSVVVVTDRRHLDQQLQDAIYQIEKKQGVVNRIEESAEELAEALVAGDKIIITTLQKFPFVTEKVGELPGQNYAVIVDEAHRSQTGEMARQMKEVLTANSLDEAAEEEVEPDETYEDRLVEIMQSRGPQENLSFFGFTATPKGRTLQVFGEKKDGEEGAYEPFHLYSMRQAIEEEFILDVLKNYTTYETYYRLVKTAAGDPAVPKKKATVALARYLSQHPHNIAEKTKVMAEHFRRKARHKIGGKAKAMVLTASRLHAVRYRQAFEQYLTEEGYSNIGVLVAFSGTVRDPETGEKLTEAGMNGFSEKELPRKFATDRYQILIVANKYQTGFDQPLLQTMYVDKPLSGVRAVQSLSRLNRTHPGKDEVFVLDFVNAAEEIQAAFKDYYDRTILSEEADSQQLYDLQHDLEQLRVYQQDWLDGFARVYYKPKEELTKADQAALNRYLDPAVERFQELTEDEQVEFRDRLRSYVRLYAFVTQVMPYEDEELEKLYSYGRFLLKKLPEDRSYHVPDLTGDVDMEYYRLERLRDASDMSLGESFPGYGDTDVPTEVGTGRATDEKEPLSAIIEVLNDRFGTEFSEEDRLFFEQVRTRAKTDEEVVQRAHANDLDNFRLFMDKKLSDVMADRVAENEELASRYFDDDEFRDIVSKLLSRVLYNEIREGEPAG